MSQGGRLIDIAIVGAGAAGLATANFAGRHALSPGGLRIAALDGAKKLGAKILISGGGRCNVTNLQVCAADYFGGNSRLIERVLRCFDEQAAAAFFHEIGVALHEEHNGKLFPDSNSARTVLAALVGECERLSVQLMTDQRVNSVEPLEHGFRLTTERGLVEARRVVLATGGRSLPKTGSDGLGYRLAEQLGHSIRPTTPALAPLLLAGDFHGPLSGISHEAELTLRATGSRAQTLRGALLWTHFGISGPVAMNMSRCWHAAAPDGAAPPLLTLNFLPGMDFAAAEQRLIDLATAQPRARLDNALADWLPARVAARLLAAIGLDERIVPAHLSREDRRRLTHALTAWPLKVVGSRGYDFAEVTAGGVPLEEVDVRTMASRRCPGLFLVGEILDVDGRIGGFNFQWAWSTGFVAGQAAASEGP